MSARHICANQGHASHPYPAPDRASLSCPRGLVLVRAADGRAMGDQPRLPAPKPNHRALHRLLRRASGAGWVVHWVQSVDRQDLPCLRGRALALFRLQLLVCLRGADPEPLDGTRFWIERGDAGAEPVGLAGDGAGDKCTVTLTPGSQLSAASPKFQDFITLRMAPEPE
jgi:hypothetical protein